MLWLHMVISIYLKMTPNHNIIVFTNIFVVLLLVIKLFRGINSKTFRVLFLRGKFF